MRAGLGLDSEANLRPDQGETALKRHDQGYPRRPRSKAALGRE